MHIAETLKNVRCDTVGCHKIAKYNLDTNSYKGSTCLCLECFNNLYKAMQLIKKSTTLKQTKEKGDN